MSIVRHEYILLNINVPGVEVYVYYIYIIYVHKSKPIYYRRSKTIIYLFYYCIFFFYFVQLSIVIFYTYRPCRI